jgi:hypothetical protein
MNLNEWLLIGPPLLVVVGGVAFWGKRLSRRQSARHERLLAQWRQLNEQHVRAQQSLRALSRAALSMDAKLHELNRRVMEQQQHIVQLTQNQDSSRSYGEAIQMVRKGATAARLVSELNLSKTEAELLVMLHGQNRG